MEEGKDLVAGDRLMVVSAPPKKGGRTRMIDRPSHGLSGRSPAGVAQFSPESKFRGRA
jgi:hypothetical protein